MGQLQPVIRLKLNYHIVKRFVCGFCNIATNNAEECGWNGGDCVVNSYPNCHINFRGRVGNDACNGGEYNTEQRGWDGGDCLEFNEWLNEFLENHFICHIDNPRWIGDDICDGAEYKTQRIADGMEVTVTSLYKINVS